MKKSVLTVFVLVAILVPFDAWSAEVRDGRLHFDRMGYIAEKFVVPPGLCGLMSIEIGQMDRPGGCALVITDVPEGGGFPNIIYQSSPDFLIYPDVEDGSETILINLREETGSEFGTIIQSGMEIMIAIGYFPEGPHGNFPFSVPLNSGETEMLYGEFDELLMSLVSMLIGEGGEGDGIALGDLGALVGGDVGLPFSMTRNYREVAKVQPWHSRKSARFFDLGGLFGDIPDNGTDLGLGGLGDMGSIFGHGTDMGLGDMISSIFGGGTDLGLGGLGDIGGIFGDGSGDLDMLFGDHVTAAPGYSAFSMAWRGPCDHCKEDNCMPFFTKGADQTVNEDSGLQTVPAWAVDINPGCSDEFGQIITFRISIVNESLFAPDGKPEIDPNTGDLTYIPAPDAFGIASIKVVIQDDGGPGCDFGTDSDSEQFSIQVNFVNDAPAFAKGPDQIVSPGTQTIRQWAVNISPGAGNESFQELTFELTTDNDAFFSEPPQIDADTGDLTYTPSPDARGTAVVTASLKDDGGTENRGIDTSVPQQFRITVDPLHQVVNENAGPQIIVGWAENIYDRGEASVEEVAFQLSTDNDALFDQVPQLDTETGDLYYTPASDAYGTAAVSVTITGDGGRDTEFFERFSITVNPVNDAPSFTKGDHQRIRKSAGPQVVNAWTTDIIPGPVNEADQHLIFHVATDNDALFSAFPEIDTATGDLSYMLADDASGTAIVTVRLQDDGGTENGGIDTSEPQRVRITCGVPGDMDDNGTVDLKDAIIALQILTQIIPDKVCSGGDVNEDGKIGIEEVIFILQEIS